jgi:hypothetical protein
MYWLLGHKPKLSTSNKLLVYKAILKPIWTYEIKLWGTASTSNIEILERLQIESFPHDNGRTLVSAKYSYPKGSPNTNS